MIILDFTKNESNNCFIMHCLKKITKTHYVGKAKQPAMILLRCAYDATRPVNLTLLSESCIVPATHRLFTDLLAN